MNFDISCSKLKYTAAFNDSSTCSGSFHPCLLEITEELKLLLLLTHYKMYSSMMYCYNKVVLSELLVFIFITNICHGRVTFIDYYWQAETLSQWENVVYSNDCSFFDMFIQNYLLSMNNIQLNVNSTTLVNG